VPNQSALDLTRVTIEPFSDRAVVNRFSCGQRPLDSFLKNKAKRGAKRCEHRVFCAYLDQSPNVIGYYALQLGNESVSELPDANKDNYLKTYVAFPAVNLGFLAVDAQYHRQGLGQHLLIDGKREFLRTFCF
jgi:ribosomal protein S18 acetylase RimI-like enzyme